MGRNFSNEFYSQKMRCRAGVIYFLELIIVRELHPAPQLEGWLSRLLARFQPQDEIRGPLLSLTSTPRGLPIFAGKLGWRPL